MPSLVPEIISVLVLGAGLHRQPANSHQYVELKTDSSSENVSVLRSFSRGWGREV